jgi:hypothetical protein
MKNSMAVRANNNTLSNLIPDLCKTLTSAIVKGETLLGWVKVMEVQTDITGLSTCTR